MSLEEENEEFSSNYGDVTENSKAGNWREAVEGKKWANVSDLVEEMAGSEVLIRGRVDTYRPYSSKVFVILRQGDGCKGQSTVQCVAKQSNVGVKMIKYLKQLTCESILDVIGVLVAPKDLVKGPTQKKVEIQVRKVYCVSRALARLPLGVEDAARSEADIEKSLEMGIKAVRVNQDTRLNNRFLDIRTAANQAIIHVECRTEHFFRGKLLDMGFVSIHTPKLIAGSSEGGSAVFKLDYKGQPACLAQSPQLHKQMAICGDLRRVFVVGPVFRAEDSFTHRHLCEFVGLDVEMEIHKDYSEIMDLVDELFVYMFTELNEKCKKKLEAIGKQYPFEPLKFLEKTLRLTFEEGIQMLKEAGVEVDPLGDLNTESERKLGQLVFEKYKTEFYILHRYPTAVRPFYTMPCADNPLYSNSFDVFIRGEEIMSGGQRIHIPEVLEERAVECGIDVNTISTYIDSFRYGAPLHGGFGVGLERVVMLFCALDNIRKTSLFPRDPKRLAP
ncbi:unnamed protein product [Eruca vesicaria subsp. sativa]|uniref:aspartate--tRNA ligase n=1 Tax=Eruca vesicaria subsp. sativa TaxID=29727 RepID=A0ABC8K3P9_ERUVS|nr:unnamed protein product [Eruca vesicaria subsp. sativa]